jgi:DNA polymerase II small subunit
MNQVIQELYKKKILVTPQILDLVKQGQSVEQIIQTLSDQKSPLLSNKQNTIDKNSPSLHPVSNQQLTASQQQPLEQSTPQQSQQKQNLPFTQSPLQPSTQTSSQPSVQFLTQPSSQSFTQSFTQSSVETPLQNQKHSPQVSSVALKPSVIQTNNTTTNNTITTNILTKNTQTNTSTDTVGSVLILKTYADKHKEVSSMDFVEHYLTRFTKISQLLKSRSELDAVTSISRLKQKTESEKISTIAMVKSKQTTKNEHIMLTLEDKSGEIRALAVKSKQEVFEVAKNLSLDDVVGITGQNTVSGPGKDAIIFIDQIIFPDLPSSEVKRGPNEHFVVFTGDWHIGSKLFLQESYDRFCQWLHENPQVKYLVMVGDIIEGVGVYPNQEHDLVYLDAKDQYKEAARLLLQLPKDLQIILCPGNHDVMRLAEPQPPLYKDWAKEIYELPNVHLVSSPSVVNIDKTPQFAGFNILLYHGYSYFHYIDTVEQLRKAGGVEHIELVMEYLLKRRHLAPTHDSTQFMPDRDRDDLFIDIVPDFFVSGHVHKFAHKRYKSTTLFCCSCFVAQTDYMKKVGVVPDLAKVPLVNLRTREVQLLDFE